MSINRIGTDSRTAKRAGVNMVNVDITESAQDYLKGLLDKQKDNDGIGIRMFVANPGTSQAETCIAYCRPGEEKPDDEIIA